MIFMYKYLNYFAGYVFVKIIFSSILRYQVDLRRKNINIYKYIHI